MILALGIGLGLILGVALTGVVCYIRLKWFTETIDHTLKRQESQARSLRAALMVCRSSASEVPREAAGQVEWVDRVVDYEISGCRDDEVEAAIAAQALKLLEE